MLEDMRVRREGGISKPSSDISPNWKDMRSESGYTMLYAMLIPKKMVDK